MNITTIIPIHKFDEKIGEYLKKALESIKKQEGVEEKPKVILVYPPEIDIELKKILEDVKENLSVIFVENKGSIDYQSQINLAVKSVETDYFSVLEFDDEYSTSYFKNVMNYVKAYPDVDVFLTMMIEVNENNQGVKLTNETVWAQQFVGENGELGYLNLNALKKYTDFKLSGAAIKKSKFENLGGYKSNIKLTFMYEFLLRALNNTCKIFSIPKIGYKHLAVREDSLFDYFQKNMSMEERKFWFDTAGKESNFTTDREIDTSWLKK